MFSVIIKFELFKTYVTCYTDITDNFSYELCQSAMDTFVDPIGDKKPTEAKTIIDPPIMVEPTKAQTITDLPIETQNNSDLPIVVEPLRHKLLLICPLRHKITVICPLWWSPLRHKLLATQLVAYLLRKKMKAKFG